MSVISGLGSPAHYHHALKSAATRAAADATSLTASTLSGSITGSSQALGSAGANGGVSSDVLKQIEQAVTSALQSSKPTDDPHKVVQNAILAVLKKNKGAKGSQDGDVDPTDADGTHRTFDQTLQAYGITPQQFRAQLLAAVHQTGAHPGGPSNVSSFPPGVVLDTTG